MALSDGGGAPRPCRSGGGSALGGGEIAGGAAESFASSALICLPICSIWLVSAPDLGLERIDAGAKIAS